MQDHDSRAGAQHQGPAASSSSPAVGKQTLTTHDTAPASETVGRQTLIMRQAAGPAPASNHSAAVDAAASSTGSKLPEDLGGRLGQALEADVSGVRVHTGPASAAAAADVNAHAYATGQDIHFASGAYDPGSSQGQRLIAHEVAHTVQQRDSGGLQLKSAISSPGDAHEVEADRFADAFVSGGTAPVTQAATAAVSRQEAASDLPPEIANLTLDQCRQMVRDMYLGRGEWDHRGILDHKIDAVNDMQVRFNQPDPPSLESRLLTAAIAIGAGAAAGALGAVFTTPIGGALVWGANGLITSLANFFPSSSPPLNPNEFTQRYLGALREGWPTALSANQLNTTLGTEIGQARRATAEVKRLRDNHELVKSNQRSELLDEWTNALLGTRDNPQARGGMAEVSYDDPTEGRLHLEGASMTGQYALGGPPQAARWYRGPDSATMEGVPGPDARNANLDRKLKDIRVARTMGVDDVFGHWRIFTAALTPTGEERLESVGHSIGDDGMRETKARLAQYATGNYLDPSRDRAAIDSNWGAGLTKVWDQVRNRTLREMGIASIGS
jgi:hypothetical protein